jgi:phosphatidylserine/phosphatidylglycerophosphate/cardiolipin synthase-like enzyme
MGGLNENEGLYKQILFYNEEVGPYQCMSLPWWVRTANHRTYPPRHRGCLEPLICGETVFGRIAADLLAAQRSADIITWGFDPGMVLVRNGWAEDGMRYGDLLKQIATRKDNPVMVRLLVWHDDAFAHHHAKNNPGFFGSRLPTIGGYAGYFSEAHDRYNHEWFDEIIAGNVPNIFLHVRNVPAVCVGPALADETYKSSAKGVLGTLYPTHHQKMVLIDYEIPDRAVGYVMGHNSTTDFWDTAEHHFRDPRREVLYHKNPAEMNSQFDSAIDDAWNSFNEKMLLGLPSQTSRRKDERAARFTAEHGFTAKPYQDVSLRVRGPVLYDLNHNFCYSWIESGPAGSTVHHALWLSPPSYVAAKAAPVPVSGPAIDSKLHPLPEFVESRKKLKPDDFKLSGGQHSAQLMRTQPMYMEKSIKECYANLTRLAQRYIFIQNQYIQYEDWATYLTDCGGKLRGAGYAKPMYVFILTSTPEDDGMDIATFDVAKHLSQSDTMVVEHADAVAQAKRGKAEMPITADELSKKGINVVMCSLWTCDPRPTSADDYEEIYIHAKVAIVDDAAFTIGSANLNVRSMALDSELNVLSQAKDVAYELRKSLFKQCTNDEGPAQFADIEETFQKWKGLMNRNTESMTGGSPLSGQILPFHVNRKPGSPVI